MTNSGPSSVTAGSNATYTITVTNNGPNGVNSFALQDILPTGATFVSMTQTAGTDSFTFGQSGSTLTESASTTINSGSSDTFSLVVAAPSTLAAGAAFSDTASVSSNTSTTDPNSANNTSTVTGSIVGAPADLAVSNTPSVTTANEGDNIVYTVKVSNLGPNLGTGVVLTDTLGTNLSYVSATASQGTFSNSNGVITFNVGSIASGATATLTVTGKALEAGTLTNSSALTATSADSNTANNSATATTTVNEPVIAVANSSISATTTTSQTYTAGTFTHASGVELVGAFSASINWGDGTSSAGIITLSGTTYTVKGTHKYSKTGTYKPTVTVTEPGQAAELLLAKAGDEVPALPDRYVPQKNHSHSSVKRGAF